MKNQFFEAFFLNFFIGMFYAKVDVSIDTLHSKIGHQNCSFVVGTPLQPFTMAMPRGNSRIGQQLKCSSFPVEVCWEKGKKYFSYLSIGFILAFSCSQP